MPTFEIKFQWASGQLKGEVGTRRAETDSADAAQKEVFKRCAHAIVILEVHKVETCHTCGHEVLKEVN